MHILKHLLCVGLVMEHDPCRLVDVICR